MVFSRSTDVAAMYLCTSSDQRWCMSRVLGKTAPIPRWAPFSDACLLRRGKLYSEHSLANRYRTKSRTVSPDLTLVSSRIGQLLDEQPARGLEYHVALERSYSFEFYVQLILVKHASAEWRALSLVPRIFCCNVCPFSVSGIGKPG